VNTSVKLNVSRATVSKGIGIRKGNLRPAEFAASERHQPDRKKLTAKRGTSAAPEISAEDRKTILGYPGIVMLMDTVFAS
jgi:hypothetical protein